MHAGDRVLNDHRARWLELEAVRSLQERIRSRLPVQSKPGEIQSVDAHVEQIGDLCGREHRRAVVARGDDGRLDILRSKRAHQFDRRLITLDTLLVELLQKVLIFQVPQAVHGAHGRAVVRCAERQVDPARLEKGCGAVLSWLPVHVAAVVVLNVEWNKRFAGLCGSLLEKLIEQSLPGRRMHPGCLGQHSVEIEQDRIVVSG